MLDSMLHLKTAAVLPLNKPAGPSRVTMSFMRAMAAGIVKGRCVTWNMILVRSRGATAVFASTPAKPALRRVCVPTSV